MPAFLILDIEVHDREAYATYIREVPPLVARHGGEYLVRGGEHEVIEGSWSPHRLVVFRFPSRRAIHEFYDDPDYEPIRHRAALANMVAVEGYEPE